MIFFLFYSFEMFVFTEKVFAAGTCIDSRNFLKFLNFWLQLHFFVLHIEFLNLKSLYLWMFLINSRNLFFILSIWPAGMSLQISRSRHASIAAIHGNSREKQHLNFRVIISQYPLHNSGSTVYVILFPIPHNGYVQNFRIIGQMVLLNLQLFHYFSLLMTLHAF